MGIRKFFKNTGSWMKDKFHQLKNGVTKFAKVAAPVVKNAVNFIDKTPVGGVIDAFTGGMFDKAKKLVSLLPDGSVKNAASNFTNRAEELKNKAVDELNTRQEQARNLINKGRDVIDRGREIIDM